jgi:hypothetical protein
MLSLYWANVVIARMMREALNPENRDLMDSLRTLSRDGVEDFRVLTLLDSLALLAPIE